MNQTPERSGIVEDACVFGVAACCPVWENAGEKVRTAVARANPLKRFRTMDSGLLESLSVELLPVQREAVQAHDLPPVLGEKSSHSDLISFLDHVLLPADPGQHVGAIRFDAPLLDFPFVILYVQTDKYMRIGP